MDTYFWRESWSSIGLFRGVHTGSPTNSRIACTATAGMSAGDGQCPDCTKQKDSKQLLWTTKLSSLEHRSHLGKIWANQPRTDMTRLQSAKSV